MAFKINLGTIQLKIGADTDEYHRKSKAVRNELDTTNKSLTSSIQRWGKWGAAIATGATVATAAMLKFRASAIDNLAKTSDKLGIATEQLAGLRLAAEQTGNSARNFDLGLQRMTRRVAEAAQGTGEAKKAIAELGLNAQRLAAMSPDKQFLAIADAMKGVTSQSDKVRLGFKLFDSEGVGLINTLDKGREGLQEFQEQAERLGIAITREDAGGIEAMNDAINLAKKSVEGGLNKALIKMAPIITALANAFIDLTSDTDRFGKVMDNVIGFSVKVIGTFADGWRGIRVIIKAVEVVARGFVAALTLGFAKLIGILESFGNTIIDAVATPMRKLIEFAAIFSDEAEEALGKFDDMVTAAKSNIAPAAEEFAKAQGQAFETAREELHNLMMEPLPSQNIAEFVSNAQSAVREEIKKHPPIDITGGALGGSGGEESGAGAGGKEKPTEREKIDPFIAQLQEIGKTEEELELLRFNRKLERLESFTNQELEILGGRQAAERALQEEHEDRMNSITQAGHDARNRIMDGALDAGIQALAIGGKKTQKLVENLSVVSAVIKGKEAAVSAWNAGMSVGGPWAPLVAAAYATASIARTASMIKSIKNKGKSMGGMSSGGGGGVASAGRGASGSGAGEGQQQAAPQANRNIEIRMTGRGLFSTDQVRELIGQINEQIGDGTELSSSGG